MVTYHSSFAAQITYDVFPLGRHVARRMHEEDVVAWADARMERWRTEGGETGLAAC